MGYYRKMPENVEGLQIAGKKFYKAAEGTALYSMGIHTFERIAKDAKAKYKIQKVMLLELEKLKERMVVIVFLTRIRAENVTTDMQSL